MGATTTFRPGIDPYPAPPTGAPSLGDYGLNAPQVLPTAAPSLGDYGLNAPQVQPGTAPNLGTYGLNSSPVMPDSYPGPQPQPQGPQQSGFYQAPYPQPPNYLPFGSGTPIGPTPQAPGMQDFNFLQPGGAQQPKPQPAPAPQAPQQTGMSRLMDQFLAGRGSAFFGNGRMGVPGLGGASLRAIDKGISKGVLPTDYRSQVPFGNRVGGGWNRGPVFNQ